MVAALNQGYATAGSDTGHEGGDPFGVATPKRLMTGPIGPFTR
jgi:hypothetical protein